jgi:formylglycine-generating enzyme required for sulfatase activity
MMQMPPIPDFLPPPFEWLYIPQGTVLLKHVFYNGVQKPEHIDVVDAFFMAKYPITNAQYRVYRQETGYVPDWIEHQPGIDASMDSPLCPANHLRWHEAMWFCEWMTAKAGYLITLPTHPQWMRAARSDDQRQYPWGDVWYSWYCNTEDNGIDHTTPVMQYPQGASPFGVMDMVGNVCEWCLTDYYTGDNSLEIPPADDETLMSVTRIFNGSHTGSSSISSSLDQYGATTIFYSYATGIRLTTGHLYEGRPDENV